MPLLPASPAAPGTPAIDGSEGQFPLPGNAAVNGALEGRRRPLVPRTILPSPLAVVGARVYLHREEGLVRSAAMSFWRITLAFLLCSCVAIPLGILMGSFPLLRAWIEPFSNPLRYL